MALVAESAGRARSPHRPEETVLHRVVRGHLAEFLELSRSEGHSPLPKYVERTFAAYVRCGIAAHGCTRLYCASCRKDAFVAFSCKRRGLCPSCNARRMDELAAHLSEHVLPEVPLRQWVLSFPFEWRLPLAAQARLLRGCLRLFVEEVLRWLEAPHRPPRPTRARGPRSKDAQGRFMDGHGAAPRRAVQGGAVVFVQRFGGSLNLNVHLHALLLDGVFVGEEKGRRFVPAAAPTKGELEGILASVVARCQRFAGRFFRGRESAEGDTEARPALEVCHREALAKGRFVRVREDEAEAEEAVPASLRLREPGRWGARQEGFDLHAGVTVGAHDTVLREKLCRYLARPAFALGRLEELRDGRVAYRCKETGRQRWRVLEPLELLARLAALVPPPRYPMVSYHGVLAPNAARRSAVVPVEAREKTKERRCEKRRKKAAHEETGGGRGTSDPGVLLAGAEGPGEERGAGPVALARVPWAELLRRVHGVDALRCPRCGGPMRVVAVLVDEGTAQRVLRAAGEPWRVPARGAARGPPE